MALLFETNGDWPSDDEDYRNLWDEDKDDCFFCDSSDSCVCDAETDWKIEEAYLDELELEDE